MPKKDSSRKIRLVGGPFGGKVMDSSDYGRNMIVVKGPKNMNRKQKWEWMQNNADKMYFHSSGVGMVPGVLPHVEARYELCIGPFVSSGSVFTENSVGVGMVMAPLRHPDGSLFYQYIEGTKRELGS